MMLARSPSKQNLRRPVPPCRDVICVRGPGPDLTCEAEVRNFDEIWSHAQHVLRFHITVEVAMFVHKCQPL